MTAIFLGLVAAGSLLALLDWRLGLLAMVLVGVLQDPVRKITVGTPSVFVLTAGAIWACAVVGALLKREIQWRQFRSHYRGLGVALPLFAVLLIPPSVRSAVYAPGSWQFTVVGLFIYGSLLMGIMMGENYPRGGTDIRRLLGTYCVLTALATSGVVIERLGLWYHPAIGTDAMGFTWITHRTGEAVRMLAGFYRSPDVQGWHGAMLIMLSVVLAVWSRRWTGALWMATAAMGGLGVMLCGRRKMVSMLPVFLLAYAALHVRHGRIRHLGWMLAAVLAGSVAALAIYQRVGPDRAVERFYRTALDTGPKDLRQHGFDAVIGTYDQAGFFGYGLGMATQGTQHIAAERPRIWQESGPSKVMAELGVPGFIAFVLLAVTLLISVVSVLGEVSGTSLYPLFAGLAAVVVANGASAIVSAQIFGDPYISSFLSLLIGIVLSAARVRRAAPIRSRSAPAPAAAQAGVEREAPSTTPTPGSTPCALP